MILKTIIDRLNQRVEVSNIFDRLYGLCELNGDNGWVNYIGNGEAIPVTNYDAKVGTLFWARRGKVNISKIDSLRVSGCKQMYSTKFNLSAFAVVKKNHVPCDGEDAADWIASRVYKLVSGRDYGFKEVIDVVSYEVIPVGYTVGDKSLPENLHYATVVIELLVEIVSGSEDTCYDICDTGDIPLPPDFLPCNPCLTEVAVDGVTIGGNGTEADPLYAIGGGGGGSLIVKDEGTNVSTNTTTLNFTGDGVTASLTSPGVVEVNIPSGGGGGGTLLALPFTTDHLSATGNAYAINDVVYYLGNVYRCIANNDSILPTNASYWTNLGAGFPLVEQPSDWSATSGNNQILNKPTIPATIVEDVTATAPLSSSGGATPDISITQATTVSDGYLSATDFNTFDGKQDALTAGTGIDLTGNIVTNTAPDQTVTLTAGTGISVSGTYPSFTIDNTSPSGGGTVTSVAATVPNPTNPAYSVSVPNSTTTPSIDITANGAVSQYVRGDGSLANFPLSGGGGASVNYYLNGSVNQGTFSGVTYYEMNRTPIIGGGTLFSIAANGYIASFITDAGDPNLLNIPAGNWNFETYFSASSGGGNPNFYLELYKYDGANFILIASNSSNPEAITGGTVTDLYISALAVPQTALLATDRLAVRIFVNNSGRTITLHTENNSLCQIITTFTTGLTALNGLTEQVQNFATGTSGTDFNINSATATHTFNLPTASALNRGALSGVDWSTFNAKQDALISGTNIKTVNSNSLLGSGNVSVGTVTSVGLTMPAAFSVANSPVTTSGTLAVTGAGTTAEYIRGDGTLATFPAIPAASVVYKSSISSATHTGTANTVKYTQLIPANTFVAGDVVRITYRTAKTGTANSMTLRIYANTTPDLSGSPILLGSHQNAGAPSFLVNQMIRHLAIKTANNNTEVYFAPGLGVATDYGLYDLTTTAAVNWTIQQYIVFALQLNTSGADVTYASLYLIEKP